MKYEVKHVPDTTSGYVVVNEMGHQISGVMSHTDAAHLALVWMNDGVRSPVVASPMFKKVIELLVDKEWTFEVCNARDLVNGDPLSMLISEDKVGTELRFLYLPIENTEMAVYDYDHDTLVDLFVTIDNY